MEVLRVDISEVVVAFYREDRVLLKMIMQEPTHITGVVPDLTRSVVPLVMRGSVASPHDNVGLDASVHEVAHVEQSLLGEVAGVGTPGLGFPGWVNGFTGFIAAADYPVTAGIVSSFILKIEMGIGNMKHFESLPFVFVLTNLLIEVIDIVIFSYFLRFITENPFNIILRFIFSIVRRVTHRQDLLTEEIIFEVVPQQRSHDEWLIVLDEH